MQSLAHDHARVIVAMKASCLKHKSTSPEFVWGFQCSLIGSKIHYFGREKSNSLHGSTQVRSEYSSLGSDS